MTTGRPAAIACHVHDKKPVRLQLQHGQGRLVQVHCGDIVSRPSPCALFYTCHHTIRRRECRYNTYVSYTCIIYYIIM